jgi:hypothetical protein
MKSLLKDRRRLLKPKKHRRTKNLLRTRWSHLQSMEKTLKTLKTLKWNAAIEYTSGMVANKFSNLSKAVGKRLAKNDDGPKPEDEVISLVKSKKRKASGESTPVPLPAVSTVMKTPTPVAKRVGGKKTPIGTPSSGTGGKAKTVALRASDVTLSAGKILVSC